MPTKKLKAAAATDALLAVSTAAGPDDHKNEIILQCIVSTFDAQGLNHINDQQARIVWSTIDDAVITLLGNGVRDCINSKGFDSVGLAGPFQNLKNTNQVTVVSDLVKGISGLVTP